MFLAGVINKYEDEMICDLAETYHLFDYRKYKPSLIAVLVSGLKEDSRIYHAVNGGFSISSNTLLSIIADYCSLLWWSKTEDGSKNRNRPGSITQKSLNIQKKSKKNDVYMKFSNAEEFMKARYGGK